MHGQKSKVVALTSRAAVVDVDISQRAVGWTKITRGLMVEIKYFLAAKDARQALSA